jgi:two-component system, OmpR family, sensor histidine kinase VicK
MVSPLDSDNQKTQVLYGVENILNFTLNRFLLVKEKSDTCLDSSGPSVLVTTKPIWDSCKEFKKRGIRHRLITEITSQNIDYCKELMRHTDELRHLDGIKGNFSVSERDYQATALVQESQPLSESMHTTVKSFIEQQQYVFDTLWNKAIPAKQRLREIEEGLKRDFIDTIRDPNEVQSIIAKLISSAIEEIMLTFPTVNTFNRFQKEKMLDLLKNEATNNGIKIRILVDRGIKRKEDEIHQLTKECPNITIQYLNPSAKTQVITIIADRELSLVMELKNDNKETTNEAIGLSTYSNSESTVLSYASIFETLWIQSEIAGGVY